VRASSGIKALPQLAGKKVVTVRGGTQETNIRAAVPSATVVTFENTQQAFQALQQGKGIAYVNDESSLLADYGKLGPAAKNFVILPTSIGVESIALGLRKGEAGLKAVVDATLRELEKSGAALNVIAINSSALRAMATVSKPGALLESNLNLSEVLGDGPKQSGGKREEIVASAGIFSGLQELAEALRNQYAVSFSRPDRPKDTEKLSVSVKRSGLTVRAPVKLRLVPAK